MISSRGEKKSVEGFLTPHIKVTISPDRDRLTFNKGCDELFCLLPSYLDHIDILPYDYQFFMVITSEPCILYGMIPPQNQKSPSRFVSLVKSSVEMPPSNCYTEYSDITYSPQSPYIAGKFTKNDSICIWYYDIRNMTFKMKKSNLSFPEVTYDIKFIRPTCLQYRRSDEIVTWHIHGSLTSVLASDEERKKHLPTHSCDIQTLKTVECVSPIERGEELKNTLKISELGIINIIMEYESVSFINQFAHHGFNRIVGCKLLDILTKLYDYRDIEKNAKKYNYLEIQIQALISFASLLALGDRTDKCLAEVRKNYGTISPASFWRHRKLSPFLEKELKDFSNQITVGQILKKN